MPPAGNITPVCRALLSLMTDHQDELSASCAGLRESAYDLYALMKPKGGASPDPAFTRLAGLAAEYLRRRRHMVAAGAAPKDLAALNDEAIAGIGKIGPGQGGRGAADLEPLKGSPEPDRAYRKILETLDADFRGYYSAFSGKDLPARPGAQPEGPAWVWETADGRPHPDPCGAAPHPCQPPPPPRVDAPMRAQQPWPQDPSQSHWGKQPPPAHWSQGPQGVWPQQQAAWPPQQGGAPPQQQGVWPQRQAAWPPQQGGAPPQRQAVWPQRQAVLPPQQGGAPPQRQAVWPPQQQAVLPPQQQAAWPQQPSQAAPAPAVQAPAPHPGAPSLQQRSRPAQPPRQPQPPQALRRPLPPWPSRPPQDASPEAPQSLRRAPGPRPPQAGPAPPPALGMSPERQGAAPVPQGVPSQGGLRAPAGTACFALADPKTAVFAASACLPWPALGQASGPGDAFRARFAPGSGWCAAALCCGRPGDSQAGRHSAEAAEAAVGLFLGTAAASDVFKAYEGNRELFKEWRRCFAEDPESSGGPEREGQCRQALPLGPIVARAFGEPFGKKARACSAFMFAAALKLPVCWIIVTLRSGPGEAAVLGAMVPGGKACPPLLSRPCGGASGPAALAGPEAAGRARVSLPVSFEGVILAGEGAMAAWFPERGGAAGAAAWGAFWNGDLKGSAPALFEPSAPLPSRAEALAGSLAAAGAGRGPARAGLAAAVIR